MATLSFTGALTLAARRHELWFLAGAAVGLAGWAIATVPWSWTVGVAVLLGGLQWTATEYLLHRFLLHLPLPAGGWWRALLERIHARHHHDPDDVDYLFVPEWAAVPLVLFAALPTWLVLGVRWVPPAMLTFNLFFLWYEWAHFTAHRPYRPLTAYGRYMKRHHLLHHFADARSWFGLTTPVLDLVLGTWRRAGTVTGGR